MSEHSSHPTETEPQENGEHSADVLTAVMEVLERQIAWEKRQEEFSSRQNELLQRLTDASNATQPENTFEIGISNSPNSPTQQELSDLIQKTRLQRKAISAEFREERSRLKRAWDELRIQQAQLHHHSDCESEVRNAAPVAQFDSSEIDAKIEKIEQQFSQRIESMQSALTHAHREQSRAEDEFLELAERFRDIERRVDWLETQNKDLVKFNEELKSQLQNGAKKTPEPPTEQDESALWEAQKQALLMQYGGDTDATMSVPAGGVETESTMPIEPVDVEAVIESSQSTSNEHQIPVDDEHIADMRKQWSEKLRSAEVELSIERANIARERNQLEERLAHMERQISARQKESEKQEEEQLEEEASKSSWSWLSFGRKKSRNITIDSVTKQRRKHAADKAKQDQVSENRDNYPEHESLDDDSTANMPDASTDHNPNRVELNNSGQTCSDSEESDNNDSKPKRRRKRKRK